MWSIVAKLESKNRAKSNRIFPGRERGLGHWFWDIWLARDRTLILGYLDSVMAKVFLAKYLFFSISIIFRAKREVKVGQKKCKLRVFFVSLKIRISQRFLKKWFLSLNPTSGENISKIRQYWWSYDPKTPQKGPFHGC